jgi:hypothetical protein
MAGIDVVNTNAGKLLFYNVDAAVGKGCQNGRSDVLLVQYLLREGCKAPDLAEIQTGAGFTSTDITGIWDQYWDGYLANYLRTLKRKGKRVVEDRRVDPVVGGRPIGSIHHMQYTILFLNLGYGQLRPNDFPRMSEAGDCPGELRQLIRPKFVR